jgi:hypothetical protein
MDAMDAYIKKGELTDTQAPWSYGGNACLYSLQPGRVVKRPI